MRKIPYFNALQMMIMLTIVVAGMMLCIDERDDDI